MGSSVSSTIITGLLMAWALISRPPCYEGLVCVGVGRR